MRFAIRDDDTCYFTKPEELERVWGRVLPYAPVSLAITPFALQAFHLGNLERFYQGSTPEPLANNTGLVQWLREHLETGSISVMCHGSTHEYKRVSKRRLIQEYVWKSRERLALETQQAKDHLQQVLQTRVNTFVPPGNAISRAGLEAIQPSFPHVLTTLSLRRWHGLRLDRGSLEAFLRRLYHQLRYGAPSPGVEQLGGVKLLPSFSLTRATSWEMAEKRFQLCRKLETDFVVAVHYWEINAGVRSILDRLLETASAAGCTFTHCQDLFLHRQEAGMALHPQAV
ncbi:MAG: DUF2334 domain-containing protein [Acidimicrobiia bacterium]|nr:DUF2334 domain-containing protein [Acidimicrobiia bacterium]